MSIDNKRHPEKAASEQNDSGKAGWRVSRRSLAAAAAVFAAGLASRAQSAKAMGWPGIFDRPGKGKRNVKCFLAGTRVLTPAGEVEVGALKVGDHVVTRSGAARPVIGLTVTSLERPITGHWERSVLPVTVQRGALGPDCPHRDLHLSQSHALLIDGALYAVGDLINGITIREMDASAMERIDYVHIELAIHDVVIAEGAPCETYRRVEAGLPEMAPCAPLLTTLNGPGARLKSRLRSAAAPLLDVRTPADRMRDQLEDRAEIVKAA